MNLPQVIRRPAEYPSYTSSFHIFFETGNNLQICLFRLAPDTLFLDKSQVKGQKIF